MNDAGNIWSSLAPKFAFAKNTSVNYTTGKVPYKLFVGTKLQIPKSLKHGLYRSEHKLCCSESCKELPPHSHSDNILKNQLLDNLLRPHLSRSLSERKRDFKRFYFRNVSRAEARSHAYRNRIKLGQYIEIGQKILYPNSRQDLSNSRKIQQQRLGPFQLPNV